MPVATSEKMLDFAWPIGSSAYALGNRIGCDLRSGAFVHEAVCSSNGVTVAVKRVDLETQTSLKKVQVEVAAMRQLQHPNLVPLHAAFVTRGELWLVLEYHSFGSCADIMRWSRPHGLEEGAVAAVVCSACRGLSYLHANGTLHRQLKSSNILVDAHGDVRLTDFGLSGNLFVGGERRSRLGTFVGTPEWMAPEVLEQASGYSSSADVWSLGITIIELCTGNSPYAGLPPLKVMLQVSAAPGMSVALAFLPSILGAACLGLLLLLPSAPAPS